MRYAVGAFAAFCFCLSACAGEIAGEAENAPVKSADVDPETGMLTSGARLGKVELARLFSVAVNEIERKAGKEAPPVIRPATNSPLAAPNPVRVTYLVRGVAVAQGASGASSLLGNVKVSALSALEKVDSLSPVATTILIEIAFPLRPLESDNPFLTVRKLFGGRQGVLMTLNDKTTTLTASEIVMSGSTVENLLENAGLKLNPKLDENELRRFPEVGMTPPSFRVYDAFLAVKMPDSEPVALYRSGSLVSLAEVNADTVRGSLALTSDWFFANVQPDGSFPYLYDMVNDRYHSANPLLIRNIYGIATVGDLWRAGERKNEKLRALGVAALEKLLRERYVDHPTLPISYITDRNDATLGNAAAALSAIIRLGELERQRPRAERLVAFIKHMRQTSGRYATLLSRPDSNSSRDYYPGEAQLALMEWHEATRDPSVLDLVEESFRFYRDYFRATPKTAFIPWHTQACVKLYRASRKREVAEFVFEMNNYLLNAQQTSSAVPEDCQGQFLSPEKGKGGRPHASGTGVYLEGLAEAYALARDGVAPPEIAARYRRALVWGLRNILQLQVRSQFDAWYLREPARALGGFRTNVDEAAVRIDNMQHCGNAIAKASAILGPLDYQAALAEENAAKK